MEEENKNPASTEEENPSSNEEEGKTNPQSDPSQEEGTNEDKNPPATEDPNKKGEGQSKEENAKFAKLRHERDVAKAKAAGDAEGYKRARIKSVGGKNPYSNDSPIETDEDYEFYELQDEVNSRGLDPKNPLDIEKVRRELASKKAEEAERNKSQAQKDQDKADQEVKDYLAEGHTREELKKYWADEKFQEFASDLIGVVPLKTIIAKFDKAYPKENPAARKEAANKTSSPGSASNDEQEVPKKAIKDMNREEFAEYMKKVERGKIKIDS